MNRILRVLWFGCILAVAPFFTNTANALVCTVGACLAGDEERLEINLGACSNPGTVRYGTRCYQSCGGAQLDAGICTSGSRAVYTFTDTYTGCNVSLGYCTSSGSGSTQCTTKTYSASNCSNSTTVQNTVSNCSSYTDYCFGGYRVRTCNTCDTGYSTSSRTYSVSGCSNTFSYNTCMVGGEIVPVGGGDNEGCQAYSQDTCTYNGGTSVAWTNVYSSTDATLRLYQTEPACENSRTSSGGFCCLMQAYYKVTTCPTGWYVSGSTCRRSSTTTGNGTTRVKVTTTYGTCSVSTDTGACSTEDGGAVKGWGYSAMIPSIRSVCYSIGNCQT
ncbi:MAG: hypothetical protein IJ866_02200 [Alphaproteobacteria bacterium]|nr:hypothetical protein [Alphaproteobacteria bacterium]